MCIPGFPPCRSLFASALQPDGSHTEGPRRVLPPQCHTGEGRGESRTPHLLAFPPSFPLTLSQNRISLAFSFIFPQHRILPDFPRFPHDCISAPVFFCLYPAHFFVAMFSKCSRSHCITLPTLQTGPGRCQHVASVRAELDRLAAAAAVSLDPTAGGFSIERCGIQPPPMALDPRV